MQQAVAQILWARNVLLMQRVKDLATRIWYAEAALLNGWSRNILQMQIETAAHKRQGKATNNFASRLPPPQSYLVQEASTESLGRFPNTPASTHKSRLHRLATFVWGEEGEKTCRVVRLFLG